MRLKWRSSRLQHIRRVLQRQQLGLGVCRPERLHVRGVVRFSLSGCAEHVRLLFLILLLIAVVISDVISLLDHLWQVNLRIIARF